MAKKLDKVVFITFQASIFGYDIPVDAYGKLYDDLNSKAVVNPKIIVSTGGEAQFDTQTEKIIIGNIHIRNAIEDKEKASAKLLHILLEEYGEYIEYLLRTQYSNVQESWDTVAGWSDDEGAKFAFALPKFDLEKVQDINYAKYTNNDGTQELVYDNTKTYEQLISVKDKKLLISNDGVSLDGRYKYFSAGRGEPGKASSYGHEKLEDALENIGFRSADERKEIYFGNWLRDYSQVVDAKILEFDLNDIQASLENLSGEKASATISKNISNTNEVMQKHISRQSLTYIVGVLAEDEFIDIYTGKNKNNEAFKITQELLGVYIPAEHLDNPKGIKASKSHSDFREDYKEEEGQTNKKTYSKNYFEASIAYTKEQLSLAVSEGKSPKGRVHFGAALHVLEDLYSHSNYCEILVHKIKEENKDTVSWKLPRAWTKIETINGKEIYPLVTGTFGSLDTMVSFLSILEKIMDTPINCNKEGRSKSLRIALIILRDYDLDMANTLEDKIKFLEKWDNWIPEGIDICSHTKKIKQYINDAIAFLAQKTLSEFPRMQEIDPVHPTHSQIGKDHDDHPLHTLAAKNAIIMLGDIGKLMFNVWNGSAKEEELLNRIDSYFTHPYLLDDTTTIPSLKKMYDETLQWANTNPGKLSTAAKYKGGIEHAREELENIAQRSKTATNFILETYLKHGEK